MRYFLAIVLPPLAVLLCGKPFQALLSVFFTLAFWVPGIIHALLVVSSTKAEERNRRLIIAIQGNAGDARQTARLPPPVSALPPQSSLPKSSANQAVIIAVSVVGFLGVGFIALIALALISAPSRVVPEIKTDATPENARATATKEVREVNPPTSPPAKVVHRGEGKSPAVTIYGEREWKSADGIRSFVGTLRKIGKGEVTIEKEEGPITFPVSMLSAADKEFLGQEITINTVDGHRHEKGSIAEIGTDSILFVKESGPIQIKMENLPKALRDRLGYDPTTAAKERQERERRAVEEIKAIDGHWILENAESGGISGKDRAPSHETWDITGESITLNSSRLLSLRHQANTNPRRLFIENRIGGRAITVYACIYRFEGNRLIVCFDAGDNPPTAFRAGASDSTFLLRFRRS